MKLKIVVDLAEDMKNQNRLEKSRDIFKTLVKYIPIFYFEVTN